MKKEVWYLPVEKPSVVGWKPPGTITGNASRLEAWTVEVLGPPVDAFPEALSPEARAVLEAAARFGDGKCDSTMLRHAAIDYAKTLAPPDPLREAREALAEAERSTGNQHTLDALERLSDALDRLAEKGGAA